MRHGIGNIISRTGHSGLDKPSHRPTNGAGAKGSVIAKAHTTAAIYVKPAGVSICAIKNDAAAALTPKLRGAGNHVVGPSNMPATVWLAVMVTVKAGVPVPLLTAKIASAPSSQFWGVAWPEDVLLEAHEAFSQVPLRLPV